MHLLVCVFKTPSHLPNFLVNLNLCFMRSLNIEPCTRICLSLHLARVEAKYFCFSCSHGTAEPFLFSPGRKLPVVKKGKGNKDNSTQVLYFFLSIWSLFFYAILKYFIGENKNPDSQCPNWENKYTIYNLIIP